MGKGRGGAEAGKAPICAALRSGGRGQITGLGRIVADERTCGSFSADLAERGGEFVSAGNCWLLAKVFCEVSQGFGGSVLNVDHHSEFTNVYKATQ